MQTPATAGSGRTRRRPRVGRALLLLVFAAYFFVPLYAAVDFTLGGSRHNMGHTLSVWTGLVHQDGFTSNLMTSLKIAAGTVVLLLVLMVPTMAWLHLRLPHLRRLVEGICLLPMAIPAVVIANGIIGAFKSWPQSITGSFWILILEYVILALPFTYRSLDAGLSAIPLTTMVEAARSLGASWPTTLWRVVVPNIRTAIASAGILGAALALGEFTIANLLLLNTFPVWTDQAGQQDGEVATTAAMLILFLSWLLLMVVSRLGRGRGRGAGRGASRRRDGGAGHIAGRGVGGGGGGGAGRAASRGRNSDRPPMHDPPSMSDQLTMSDPSENPRSAQ